MTVAGSILDRLQALGFECSADPPAVVVKYLLGPEPPPNALLLLDELKQHRAEVLAALTTPQPWDDAAERDRLNVTVDTCDDHARSVDSWADCWDWATRCRPDLVAAVDDVLDAIDAAHKRKDTVASIEACRRLKSAVSAAAAAYQATNAGKRPPTARKPVA